MPLWATVIVVGILTATSGFVLRYLITSSASQGRVEANISEIFRRLTSIDEWRKDRDAELVAYRNGYGQRPREWWR
jgi:hypothetical protein